MTPTTTTPKPSVPSVLDNKETLLHFSSERRTKNPAEKDYYRAYLRARNLNLAYRLQNSSYFDDYNINKSIRNLRFCGNISLLEQTGENKPSIFRSSGTCKNPICHICNHAKSAKVSDRIINALESEQFKELIQNPYFYFLTLTVRHNKDVRNYNYTSEYQKYLKSLFRSKTWNKYFPYSPKNKKCGWINSIELTITNNGYHIHSHALIVAPRLTEDVKIVESDLKATWKKITGDSDIIRLDLIKTFTNSSNQITKIESKSNLLKAVKELSKYSIKSGNLATLSNGGIDKLAHFLIDSKGRNFMNAYGILRGLGITANKSKFDKATDKKVTNPDASYFIDKTINLRFNHPINSQLSTAQRQSILKDIEFISLSLDSLEVTKVPEFTLLTMDYNLPYDIIKNYLKNLIDEITARQKLEAEKQYKLDHRNDGKPRDLFMVGP